RAPPHRAPGELSVMSRTATTRSSGTVLASVPGSSTFHRLAEGSERELDREFLTGQPPTFESLAGWEFRGLNHAKATRLAGIRKFVKGFYRQGPDLYGYNVKIEQGPLHEEWRNAGGGEPRRHGFYRVRPVVASERDNAHL